MSQKIFINLPVADLPASIRFFTAMGYSFDPQFTTNAATCMIVSDTIFVMLLTHGHFAQFSPKPIADGKQVAEVLICLSCESREAVDALAGKAIAAGGTTYEEPQDHGFMYGRSFQDLDGHAWELMYMDLAAMPAQS